VNDGTTTGNLDIPMGVLVGDTTGNGTVNASDVAQTKANSGQAANASNFRTDVNVPLVTTSCPKSMLCHQ